MTCFLVCLINTVHWVSSLGELRRNPGSLNWRCFSPDRICIRFCWEPWNQLTWDHFHPMLGLNYGRLGFRFATFPSGLSPPDSLTFLYLAFNHHSPDFRSLILPQLHPSSHHEDFPSRKPSSVCTNTFVVINAESSCSLA